MDSSKRKPNYLVARDVILEMTRKERYQVGEAIPSVSKLAKSLGMATISVRQALKMLADDGVLENVPGSGCYLRKLPEAGMERQDKGDGWAGDNYLAGPGGNAAPKKIRVGVLSELPRYAAQWERAFAAYTDTHEDVRVELVAVESASVLLGRKAPQGLDMLQVPAFLLPCFVKAGRLFDLDELGGLELPEEDFPKGFIQSAGYAGKVYGVPVIAAGICQFYNRKYEDAIKGLFPVDGFWDYMEKLKGLAARTRFDGLESLVVNAESLFALSLLTEAADISPCDKMKNFDSPGFATFARRFEPYFTDKRIFQRGVDAHSLRALERFFDGDAAILMGNACWIPQIMEGCPFAVGALAQITEGAGTIPLATNLNAVSASTPYPEECLDILKHLMGSGAQRCLAGQGRIVANRRANEPLGMKELEAESLRGLLDSFASGKVISTTDIHMDEYINTTMNAEMKQWQGGAFSADQLLANLRRKSKFFFRGKAGGAVGSQNETQEEVV